MTNTVVIIAARMGSTRFPGKVLADLGGKPVLQWVVDAAFKAEVDHVWVATTTEERDACIADAHWKRLTGVYRGAETDVLRRFAECAEVAKADVIVRLTGDCPFADPRIIGEVIALQRRTGVDYAQNVSPATYPDGLDVEVFTRPALKIADRDAVRPSDRDCLTQYIERERAIFDNAALICPIPGLQTERWVLDTEDDYRFCQAIAKRLEDFSSPSLLAILKILEKEPGLRKLNAKWTRNERFFQAIAAE